MTNDNFAELFGIQVRKEDSNIEQIHYDISASAQLILEEILLKMTNHIHKETKQKNLCFGGVGKKILTEQENLNLNLEINADTRKVIKIYSLYIEKLDELKPRCTMTADLTGLFDYIQEPIYFDNTHTGPRENQIIAENFYELTLPIITSKNNETDSSSNFVLSDVKSETQFATDNVSKNK